MYFLFKALFWEISKTDEKKLLKIFGNSVGSFNSLLLLGHFRAKIAFCFFFCRFMSSLMPCHIFSALVIPGSSKYLWKCFFFFTYTYEHWDFVPVKLVFISVMITRLVNKGNSLSWLIFYTIIIKHWMQFFFEGRGGRCVISSPE